MSSIKRVGIFCKPKSTLGREVLVELTGWLRKRGCDVLMPPDTAGLIDETSLQEREDIPKNADLIIVLGGDGTLLSVARVTHPMQVPILGVNLGSLGFLTEVSLSELYPTLEIVFRGGSTSEPRMLLQARILRGANAVTEDYVLNDVVINKGALARIVNLEVHVNGQYMTSYRADGLIVSTPTGSTAYSLSAGGPILHPSLDALVLSPICPFTLTNRPIVLPGYKVVQVRQTTEEELTVTLDGQTGYEMQPDDILEMQRSDTPVNLIQVPGKNYYQILRRKLHWGRPADDQKGG
ncbi:MAG: NAD(+)/NADH kinase [Nitrospina sp.]|nr:NAD(+)/NADH kinase [Nitrospina sp.]